MLRKLAPEEARHQEAERVRRAEKYYSDQQKPEVLQFRVTEQERALIEKWAKKAGMNVSEYVRANMIMALVFDGEPAAVKIVMQSIGTAAMEKLQAKKQFMQAFKRQRA